MSQPTKRFFTLFVSVIVLAVAFIAPSARAQDGIGLDVISAEYHDLLELFYRPLEPRDLLQSGWSALGAEASRRGVQPPTRLPDLPSDADAAFDIFAGAYSAYVAGLPSSFTPAMAASAIEVALADSVHEQHTRYLPPAAMRQFLLLVAGGQQMVGLGIRIGGDPAGLNADVPHGVITDVAPDSPAASVGLQPGDVLVGVDGKDLSTADSPTLGTALAGPDGSSVSVTVDRGNGQQTFEVTRGAFYFPPLTSKMLPSGVGYVRLGDFVISGRTLPNGTEVLDELDRRLDELDAAGAQGLIFDLRNNGGGSVQTADEILGRFLPETVRSVGEADERGHQTFELSAGRIRARQLPMAVLINAGSASASEITAAALRDAHRAVLVGQKTIGAVASSELLPLPGGAGLQVAVATAVAPESNTRLDGVGVTPDVVSGASRSLADVRSGRDPQVEAAVAAVANAPAPPQLRLPPTPVPPSMLDRILGGLLPDSAELPTNDRLIATDRWQRLNYIHPNELIDQYGGSRDPVSLAQTVRSRGYQGTVSATYGAIPGDMPNVSVNADIYASAEGAHAATTTNDLPELLQPANPLIQLGDETVAYKGTWLLNGASLLVWRRGRVVITVAYSDVKGFERPDSLVTISQLIDARAQQLTIP